MIGSAAFTASYVALWVLLLVMGMLVLLLYRHFGLMTLGTLEGVQRDGLGVGEEAPALSGIAADGTDVRWGPRPGVVTFLLFAATDCGPCEGVLPFVRHIAAAGRNGLALDTATIVLGPQQNAVRLVEKFGEEFLAFAEDGSGAFEQYRVRVTPFAFVIGDDLRVRAKGLCSDPFRLRDLLVMGGVEQAAAVLDPLIDEAQGNPSASTTPKQEEVYA